MVVVVVSVNLVVVVVNLLVIYVSEVLVSGSIVGGTAGIFVLGSLVVVIVVINGYFGVVFFLVVSVILGIEKFIDGLKDVVEIVVLENLVGVIFGKGGKILVEY